MELTPFKPLNSKYIVDLIVEKPNDMQLRSISGTLLTTQLNDHPYRATVIFVPEFFYINGMEHPVEIRPGDIVTLAELPNPKDERNAIIYKGKVYQVVSHTNIVGYERPVETKEGTNS